MFKTNKQKPLPVTLVSPGLGDAGDELIAYLCDPTV